MSRVVLSSSRELLWYSVLCPLCLSRKIGKNEEQANIFSLTLRCSSMSIRQRKMSRLSELFQLSLLKTYHAEYIEWIAKYTSFPCTDAFLQIKFTVTQITFAIAKSFTNNVVTFTNFRSLRIVLLGSNVWSSTKLWKVTLRNLLKHAWSFYFLGIRV